MDFELKGCKVFATANEINRLSKPSQFRFRKLLPRYTEVQFLNAEFGNSTKIIVPCSWFGRRVIAFLHSYMSKNPVERRRWVVNLYCLV